MALASRSSRPQRRRGSGELRVAIPRERESGIRLKDVDSSSAESIEERRIIASALATAVLGFDVCARRARTKDVAAKMTSIADETRVVADLAAARVPGGIRKPSTSERMRWEWLASTAALLDGGIEGRIADEANRHLAVAAAAAAKIDDDALATRIDVIAARGRALVEASNATIPVNDVALHV